MFNIVLQTPSASMSSATSQSVDVQLDRSNDKVYQATTSVVRAVMDMTKGVHQARAEQYVDLVKSVGIQLKELLSNVDDELKLLPSETHHEVSTDAQLETTKVNHQHTAISIYFAPISITS